MARCPYAPHRLVTQGSTCRRCSGDVGLYVAVQALPVQLYNQARRLAGKHEYEPAAVLLVETLRLRPDFAEALWLLAAVEAGRGRDDEACARLREAYQAGASVDLSWGELKGSGPLPAASATDEAPEENPVADPPKAVPGLAGAGHIASEAILIKKSSAANPEDPENGPDS